MAIPVMKLCTMTETELNKMTKADLIASIKCESFYPNHYKGEAEKLQRIITENATNERAACVMLAALVGFDLDRSEYSGEIDSKKLNILELVGLAAKKMADK
jgi:hypothetical protein